MFIQSIIVVLSLAASYALPIEEYVNSYTSSSLGLGAYRSSGLEVAHNYGIQYAEPNQDIHTPIIKKVPVIVTSHHEDDQDEHGPAEYSYVYGVEDKHTGDIKSQKESRHGDVVQGEYSFKEADGTIRTVKYTVDKKSGFNAVVTRSGHSQHPQVEKKKVILKPIVVPNLHDDGHYSYY
ncbi:hypothetical protein Trydic_g14143 [Trypoxylus dichotomus]